MGGRKLLAGVSTFQLMAGLAGQVVAVRDQRSFDIALIHWRGDPERVAHDSWLLGTGLSAPKVMLATQAAATARLVAGPSRPATRALGLLGATMSLGYLVEREFRSAVSPSGRDPMVTPVAVTGMGLAMVMAALGLRIARPEGHGGGSPATVALGW